MLLSRFYPIIDHRIVAGRGAVIARSLALAGCDMIQVRAKDATSDRFFSFAREIVLAAGESCRVIVNDRFDIALAAGAAGVHLGENDLPVERVRRLTPSGFIIGVTCRDPVSAVRAERDGADYLGAGAVFPTASKQDTRLIGIGGLSGIVRAVGIPVYGIAGITEDNCAEVTRTGAFGCAGIGAVCGPENPAAAFLRLESRLRAIHPE